MRVGRTLEEGRAFPDDPPYTEAVYTSLLGTSPSVFPYVTGAVPRPYGEWYNEALEGTGGWTANAPALLRYVHKMFGRGVPALFTAETQAEIRARPVTYTPPFADIWYGLGWQIMPVGNGFRILFSGGLRGSAAHLAFLDGTKLPVKLDGVEVRVNNIPAAVYYVSPTQINAQVPAITRSGTATLQVIRDGVASNPEPIEIRLSAPEYFRYFTASKGFVVATHTDGSVIADPAVLPGYRAAAAGETIQIYGTGFTSAPAGDIVSTVVPMTGATVRIGGRDAVVSFAGLVATGLFQLNVVVPAGLAAGDHVVTLSVAGAGNLASGILPVR